jgi:hypothetical protein
MDEKTGNAIATLWKDPAIRAAYELRATYHLHESARYFFERIDEVCHLHHLHLLFMILIPSSSSVAQ